MYPHSFRWGKNSAPQELNPQTLDFSESPSKKRTHRQVLCDEVIEKSKGFKYPYHKLKMRERGRRVNKLVESVLAICVDRKELLSRKVEYFEGNMDLALDVMSVLEECKIKIQRDLKVNLRNLEKEDPVPPPEEEDNLFFTKDLSQKFKRTDYTGNNDQYKTAVTMLGHSTLLGYNDIRSELIKEFNLPASWLPSFYMLTKNRPNVETFDIIPNASHFEDINSETTVDHTVQDAPQLLPLKTYSTTSFVGKTDVTVEEAITKIYESSTEKSVPSARISGDFEDYVMLLAQRYHKRNIKMTGNFMVLNSYDGAEHLKTEKKRTNIISFSSKLLGASVIKCGVTAGGSRNILTWQQVKGEEKANVVVPALESQYRSMCAIVEKEDKDERLIPDSKLFFFELHDGKMHYLLTQHSLFNRKHYPFLLCKCQRGQGVKDINHKCELISQEETLRLHDRSLRKWTRKRGIPAIGHKWTVKLHMVWVDEKNYGISHFGIHPNTLRRDRLRFDVFHLRCAITRRMMAYLQGFILGTTPDLIEEFNAIISDIWSTYNVLLFNMNKTFQAFQGEELLLFIKTIPKITKWLNKSFVETPNLKGICDGLTLWEQITPFLVITCIDNVTTYRHELDVWVDKLKKFYEVGKTTFLTKNPSNQGDDETFYMHCLRFYLPKIALDTFEKFELGLGVYTMQGFERRNKESKYTLKRFSNTKGNIVAPNLRRLYDKFEWSEL